MLDLEFWVDGPFVANFQACCLVSLSFDHHCFWWTVSRHCSPPCNASFFSVCFQSFSLSLAFSHLILMCLGVVLFEFILFGVLEASWTCKIYVFWHIWEGLAIILSKKIFFLFAFWWKRWMFGPFKTNKFWRSTVKHRAYD